MTNNAQAEVSFAIFGKRGKVQFAEENKRFWLLQDILDLTLRDQDLLCVSVPLS